MLCLEGYDARVFAKLEYLNPGGSVKDRTALGLLLAAERDHGIRPGVTTLIEPTAGNTGVGLALVARVRGYRAIMCVPEDKSPEKQQLIVALGAEIVRTPAALGTAGAITVARELAAQMPDAFVPQQFENMANPNFHSETTAAEIWDQMDQSIDAIVIGAGTGGTFSGVVRALKQFNPSLHGVVVQPLGSVFVDARLPIHPWRVEGIGNTFRPKTLDMSLADEVVDVTEEQLRSAQLDVIRSTGALIGPSSGAAAWAARELIGRYPQFRRVVTVFPDGAERNLQKYPLVERVEGPAMSPGAVDATLLDQRKGFRPPVEEPAKMVLSSGR